MTRLRSVTTWSIMSCLQSFACVFTPPLCVQPPEDDLKTILRVLVKEDPSLRGGGWYGGGHMMRCPNGHAYFIGTCGGAMEESRCPECGATIGGRNHVLAAGNTAAGVL